MMAYDNVLELDLQAYNNDSGKVDTAIRSLESMISTKDYVDQNRDSITAPMYEMIQATIESFSRIANIGMKTSKYLPSNESFSRHQDLGEITQEGLGEGIKNVYLSIIDAVKAAFNWIGGLIKRLFGRNKDHSEKIEKLKEQATVVKEESAKASPTEKRSSGGWIEVVKLKNPEQFRKICMMNGSLMGKTDIDKIVEELKQVFSKQSGNLQKTTAAGGDLDTNFVWEPPFPVCNDSNLKKQISRDGAESVYVSHELGGGQFVYAVVPPGDSTLAPIKNKLKRADGLRIGKISSEGFKGDNSRNTLSGELADGDKTIELVVELNKALMERVNELKHFQSTKERFLNDFEATIKKEGVNLFSSSDKKEKRDGMMARLKLFKKTMDEPAMTYYGVCDGLVATYAHLATTILEANRAVGKQLPADN